MPDTPTSRAMRHARELGFEPCVVERWNPHARIRQDMFGCIDIVLIHPDAGCIGVQATSGANHAARVNKALAEPKLTTWLRTGNRFEVWSYRKRKVKRCGVAFRYELRRQEIKLVGGEPAAVEE